MQEYLIDPNATQAAVKAGYSPKTAYAMGAENLRKPQIMAELMSMQAEVGKRLNITAESVLAGISATILEAKEAQQFGAALKGYELLGKNLKMWTEKSEVTGADGQPLELTIKRVITDL